MSKTFDRVVLALNRRLTRRSRQRELPAPAALPEERRGGGLRRKTATVTAALVLAIGAGTGGYWIADSQEPEQLGAAQVGAPVPAVCEARADAARAELRESGDPDGGFASMMVGMAEGDECRAELELKAAELRSEAVRDRVED